MDLHGLELFVGKWLGRELLRAPDTPSGTMTSIGRALGYPALGRSAVIQEYQRERDGTTELLGHAVLRWDASSRCYTFHWFDSTGGAPAIFSGCLSGSVFLLNGEGPAAGAQLTFDFGNPSACRLRFCHILPGGIAEPILEAVYDKTAD